MTEKQLKTRESVEALIDQLTLFDDTLMSKVFDKNIPATELLLRIILEQEDIQVKEVASQEALMNPHTDGRNIKLDIVATDSTGRYFNVEVQRSKEGAHCRRARFYSSMLDARMLKEKQKFKELMDSYVIFITEKDVVGEGLGIYHIDRIIRETQKPFEDGAHIIYVNGAYEGDDAVGWLVQDFKQPIGDDMHYEELAKGINHFKKKGGYGEMCETIEEFVQAEVQKATAETAATAAKDKEEALAKEREIAAREKEEIETKAVKDKEEALAKEKIGMIKAIMKNMGVTPEKAMEILDVPETQREQLMTYL